MRSIIIKKRKTNKQKNTIRKKKKAVEKRMAEVALEIGSGAPFIQSELLAHAGKGAQERSRSSDLDGETIYSVWPGTALASISYLEDVAGEKVAWVSPMDSPARPDLR